MPENLAALEFWLKIQTQWIFSSGGVFGLNYPSVESVMRMSQIPTADQPKLFADMQIIERAALNASRKNDSH